MIHLWYAKTLDEVALRNCDVARQRPDSVTGLDCNQHIGNRIARAANLRVRYDLGKPRKRVKSRQFAVSADDQMIVKVVGRCGCTMLGGVAAAAIEPPIGICQPSDH